MNRNTIATSLVIALGVTALGAAGCHKTGSNAGKDVTNPGQSAPVNTAQDVAGAQVGLGSAATVGGFTTNGYVADSTIGNAYEIAAAKIALERSKSPKVQDLAKMMIRDHERLQGELESTIKANNIAVTVPTQLDQRRKGMIDNLKASGDSDFDLAYLHQQLAAHLETLLLEKGFQNHGDNAALQAFAGKAAPVIQMHLNDVRKVGGDKLKAMAPGGGGNTEGNSQG